MFESVKEAFNRQSEIFDEFEENNEILKRMRLIVREHLLRHLISGSCILELNAGTGIDAVFLAKNGFKVHAIDISEGMLSKLDMKISAIGLQDNVSSELLSFTELNKLPSKSFDYIFSNFGGLNCLDNLYKSTSHFSRILRPGGMLTLVIMPPVSPWEILLAFKGKFKLAFRRLHKYGTIANIEGIKFKTFYHSFRKLRHNLGGEFKLTELQGLASVSPPPSSDYFTKQHPELYKMLNRVDDAISHSFPFNRCADHYIASFEFKSK
jgi:ubiquinone/menaquinone biosynthesis C-methylase UbiE